MAECHNVKYHVPRRRASLVGEPRGALFLDRDGVLNVDTHHPHRPEDIVWIAGSASAVRWANARGLHVIVVTNQAGIGRGLYTEADFISLTRWMLAELEAHHALVDAVFYCPHHPDDGCGCRKPAPGMLYAAIDMWKIDPARSWMIGDRPSDLAAAAAAAIPSHEFDHQVDPPLDIVVQELFGTA